MLCDVCGKIKATVHLTEIVNDQVSKLNLCESCAKLKGAQTEQHFGISDLLAGLADLGSAEEGLTPSGQRLKCSHCGLTYDDFKKIGRLGCGECYQFFRNNLGSLLKRIHGSNQHVGKVFASQAGEVKKKEKPSKGPEELHRLEQELQKAIRQEAFEEAARIRDQIRQLEQQRKTGDKS